MATAPVRLPFAWFGGKASHTHRLLPLIPPHLTYVEPFAGSLALLFAKRPSPVEVVNDLDAGIVNFYRVLRDPQTYPELVRLVALTPYARAELQHCGSTWFDVADPVERAARWFTFVRQSVAGHTSGRARGSWSFCRTDQARGMPASVSKWLSAIAGLPAVHERLQVVQIEHGSWLEVVQRFDGPETFFFLDPPYVHGTRSDQRYRHELSDDDHRELVAVARSLAGMALLCGHAHPIYEPLDAAGWLRHTWDVRVRAQVIRLGSTQARRQECAWLNPAACRRHPQLVLEGMA